MTDFINLSPLGLTEDKSKIYLTLLESGPLNTLELTTKTDIKRPYIYRLCKELAAESFVKITEANQVAQFSAMPPKILISKAKEMHAQAQSNYAVINSLLPELQKKFHLIDTSPAVSQLQGISGLKKVNRDIIDTHEEIFLLRSIYDHDDPRMREEVRAQIKKQVQKNLHTKVITPLTEYTKQVFMEHDKENLVDRHITKDKNFLLPSQIMIYGTKVAITSIKNNNLTTIIDNQEINQTFRQLFNFIWKTTQAEHDQITKNWKS